MKKKIGLVCLSFLAFLCFNANFAHAGKADQRIPIAIVDFIKGKQATLKNEGIISSIQELVTNSFIKRTDFRILDRSAMQAILQEIHTEQGEEFINSPKLVEDGKLTGAKYIITGIVTRYDSTSAKAAVSFSLKIIDLETGESKFNDVISATYSGILTGTSGIFDVSSGNGDATQHVLDKVSDQLKEDLRKVFPQNDIKIIKLEEVDSHGKLKKVIINKGDETFTKKSGMMGFGGGNKLSVTSQETQNLGGKDYVVSTVLAYLELDEVKGQISIWKVNGTKDDKEGKKIIEMFNSPGGSDKLIIKIEK
jgi:hypothetical protein